MSKRSRENLKEVVPLNLVAGGFGLIGGALLASRKEYLKRQEALVDAEIEITSRARSRTIGKQSEFFKCVSCAVLLMPFARVP